MCFVDSAAGWAAIASDPDLLASAPQLAGGGDAARDLARLSAVYHWGRTTPLRVFPALGLTGGALVTLHYLQAVLAALQARRLEVS